MQALPQIRGGQGRGRTADLPLSGAFAASLHVAGRGLTGHLAAQTMAGCRLAWPDICGRWLPVWLPLELADPISLSAEPARVRQARPADERTTSPWPANSMTFAVTALGEGLADRTPDLRILHRGLHVSGHSTRDIRS